MKAIEKRRQMAGQSGFTLIELLVVIAILGILAAVVVFAVGGITDNGQESACKIESRSVKTAVGAFRADSGDYPTGWADLTDGKFLEPKDKTKANDGLDDMVTVAFDATGATAPTYSWTAGGKCENLTVAP